MYNRYIRDQQGSFTRITEEMPEIAAPCRPPPPGGSGSIGGSIESVGGDWIRRLLGKFGMDNVDTGDLLLLMVLFLLMGEGQDADEELLIALGLLLIL